MQGKTMKQEVENIEPSLLCRGWSTKLNKWVYGYAVKSAFAGASIFTEQERFEVIPESIGRSIQRCDISGKVIFQGDRVVWGHISPWKESTTRRAIVEMNPDISFRRMDESGKTLHIFHFGNFIYANSTNFCMEIEGSLFEDSLQKLEP